jgi:hypothetical protein
MSWWEIVTAVVVFVVAPAVELWFYEAGLFWHEPKTDRRNWTPPR